MIEKIFKNIGKFFLDLVEAAVMAMAIFVLVYLFLFQPHQVRGNSMFPNFHDKQYLLTDKISYRFNEPQRGEIIIFRAPRNEKYEYIKRIIGLPGENIRITSGKIFINDHLLNEAYLPFDFQTNGGQYLVENQTIIIKQDNYLVMGDNRPNSSDSREWGLVPKENIIGKAWFRYWPPKSVGIVEAVEY